MQGNVKNICLFSSSTPTQSILPNCAVEKVILRNVATLRNVNIYVKFDEEGMDGENDEVEACLVEIKRILIARDATVRESMVVIAESLEKVRELPKEIEEVVSGYTWSLEDIQNLYGKVSFPPFFWLFFTRIWTNTENARP